MAEHTRDADGLCAGCRKWWGRFAPYPCTQAEWAAGVIGRALTERYLTTGVAP